MARVLIIKLGALGDVVMATPLVDAIVTHHAGTPCHLLTTPAFAPLFAGRPGLQVRAIERRGAGNMWRMLRFIRAQRFTRIYDLQGNDRSGALCALSGARERVGNHVRFPYTHHPEQTWDAQGHIFERLCAVLESAGVPVDARTPSLPADADTREKIDAWMEGNAVRAGDFALIHAGASASRPGKRWPYFGALAERLRGDQLTVVWLGGEPDRTLNAGLCCAGDIDATNAFSITELAELGRRARFAVTNDSGPMHVLSTASIPVFGLFGPSDWRRNHALGQAARVIACVEIDPAYAGQRTGDCLALVSADVVWTRLRAEGLVVARGASDR